MGSRTIDINRFAVTGDRPVNLEKRRTQLSKPLYKGKKDYLKRLRKITTQIDELQNLMYAQDRYGMLVIFQAMDAAGKDGTIRHVFRGVNPHGLKIHAFKRPSDGELDHSFLWRTNLLMPARGTITIFNRSYYEEVLVVKVHPEIIQKYQRIPEENLKDKNFWNLRYEAIRNLEAYHHDNGFPIIKFFLHLSKDEQRDRFLARIDTPSKNWKFAEADLDVRARWGDYQREYESAINATATEKSPWYVVPADNKLNMRLIVAQTVLKHMKGLSMAYPQRTPGRGEELLKYRELLTSEKD